MEILSARDRTTRLIFTVILIFFLVPPARGLSKLDKIDDSIYIDCGRQEGSNYTDATTGIKYFSDTNFIANNSGVNRDISQEFKQLTEVEQFWNVRSFPEGSRNCYTLKPAKGYSIRYLIRARFLYGNYDNDEIDGLPEFDLHIGDDFWDTVRIKSSNTLEDKEIIVVPLLANIEVCLVRTGSHNPFISALELRPLRGKAYESPNGTALQLFERYDFGATGYLNSRIRYRKDIYDRIWSIFPKDATWSSLSNSFSDKNAIEKNDYNIPKEVLNTAYTVTTSTGNGGSDSLQFNWDNLPNTTCLYYLYMYFAELETLTKDQSRNFEIYINGEKKSPEPILLDNDFRMCSFTNVSLDGKGKLEIWINRTENSTLPPIINAMEIFMVKEIPQKTADDNKDDPKPPLPNPPGGSKKKNSHLKIKVGAPIVAFVILSALALVWFRRRRSKVSITESEQGTSYLKRKKIRYSKIRSITSNFEKVLGEGGFGKVYHGYLDGTEVAVKTLSSPSIQGHRQFHAELELLLRVHHKNLTELVGYCNDGTNVALVYEYMAMGNLRLHLSGKTNIVLTWEDRLRIAKDTAQGLEYLHSGCTPPIVHRDVKSSNILLTERFRAKLGDFGLSKIFPYETYTDQNLDSNDVIGVSSSVAGTLGYLDPEYYATNWLNEKSDVYSFGVVLLETISAEPVLSTSRNDVHIIQWVGSLIEKGDIKNIIDPKIRENCDAATVLKVVKIAMACVERSSGDRPTMNLVVLELKDCLSLAIEYSSTRNGISIDDESKDFSSSELISQDMITSINPDAS